MDVTGLEKLERAFMEGENENLANKCVASPSVYVLIVLKKNNTTKNSELTHF